MQPVESESQASEHHHEIEDQQPVVVATVLNSYCIVHNCCRSKQQGLADVIGKIDAVDPDPRDPNPDDAETSRRDLSGAAQRTCVQSRPDVFLL